jgi:hypothetical protein
MSTIELCKPVLAEIADLLDSGGDHLFADVVRTGLMGSEEAIDDFLISNDLWGGSGSVADSVSPLLLARRIEPNSNVS